MNKKVVLNTVSRCLRIHNINCIKGKKRTGTSSLNCIHFPENSKGFKKYAHAKQFSESMAHRLMYKIINDCKHCHPQM